MTTLITTIGTGDYTQTNYIFPNQESCQTNYVAVAISQIKGIYKVVFLLTREARAKHWEHLQTLFSSLGIESEGWDIPDGQTEAETWQIFDTLVGAIPPNSQVIFDITHAFRSIPVLVLLGAAFLRKAKNVEIQGLYYGLYRSKQESTPIVDLTPALRLLDWLTATDKFITTGSAIELGDLLRTVHQDFHRSQQPEKNDPQPVNLQKFGSAIQKISRSIELIRPVHLIEKDLPKLILQSTIELEQEIGIFAKPFGLMLEQVQQSYTPLALSSKNAEVKEKIFKQFLLLQWYVDKQFTVHALLMAREWVISALCILEGYGDYLKREHREHIENQLNSLRFDRNNPELNQPIMGHVADVKALADFWGRLGDYRNDVAHVQMNEDPLDGQALEKFALKQLLPTLQSLFPSLTQLPKPEGINSNVS